MLYQMEEVVDLDILKAKIKFRSLLPTMADWIRARWAIVRGAVIGFVIGVLPGAGATIASFLAYSTEVKMTKHPEDIGKGAIEGLAAPEAANNAAAAGALVPMLTRRSSIPDATRKIATAEASRKTITNRLLFIGRSLLSGGKCQKRHQFRH